MSRSGTKETENRPIVGPDGGKDGKNAEESRARSWSAEMRSRRERREEERERERGDARSRMKKAEVRGARA